MYPSRFWFSCIGNIKAVQIGTAACDVLVAFHLCPISRPIAPIAPALDGCYDRICMRLTDTGEPTCAYAGLHDLTVAWSAPASSNGVISGYRLFYDTPDSDAYNEVELPADNFEFVAMHLDPGFTYRQVE